MNYISLHSSHVFMEVLNIPQSVVGFQLAQQAYVWRDWHNWIVHWYAILIGMQVEESMDYYGVLVRNGVPFFHSALAGTVISQHQSETMRTRKKMA